MSSSGTADCWTARPGTAYASPSPRRPTLAELADTVSPQGLLAICRFVDVTPAEALAGSPRLVVLCDQVRDPGNLGTVVRCADAFGADAVLVSRGSVDLYNPKAVRASTGSLFHLPLAIDVDLAETVDLARAAGLAILGADGSAAETTEDLARSGALARPVSGCWATRRGVCRPNARTGSTDWSDCRCTAGPRA